MRLIALKTIKGVKTFHSIGNIVRSIMRETDDADELLDLMDTLKIHTAAIIADVTFEALTGDDQKEIQSAHKVVDEFIEEFREELEKAYCLMEDIFREKRTKLEKTHNEQMAEQILMELKDE